MAPAISGVADLSGPALLIVGAEEYAFVVTASIITTAFFITITRCAQAPLYFVIAEHIGTAVFILQAASDTMVAASLAEHLVVAIQYILYFFTNTDKTAGILGIADRAIVAPGDIARRKTLAAAAADQIYGFVFIRQIDLAIAIGLAFAPAKEIFFKIGLADEFSWDGTTGRITIGQTNFIQNPIFQAYSIAWTALFGTARVFEDTDLLAITFQATGLNRFGS